MSTLLIRYPNPLLRKVAQPVTQFDEALSAKIASLFDMTEKLGVRGLGAPEVSCLEQIIVLHKASEQEKTVLINPKITTAPDEKVASEEQCLLFPSVLFTVERFPKITVDFQDCQGTSQQLNLEGEWAFFVQNKIDILNGIRIIDCLSKLKRERFLKQLQKGKFAAHHCTDSCEH